MKKKTNGRVCVCGNPKTWDAEQCEICYRESFEMTVTRVPVSRETGDPVKDWFEWISRQSRGEIS